MNNKIKRAVGIGVRATLVIVILLVIIFKYNELVNIDVRALVEKTDTLFEAGAAVVGVYGLKAIVFVIPASVLYMAVGMAFDFAPGLLVNAIGIFFELNITYFIGKFLGGEAVEKKLSASKKGQKIIELRDKKTPYLYVARLLPVFPIDFVSLFFGASNMGYVRYILISFFGVMPRIILITLLGDKIYDLIPVKFMMTVVVFALLAASVVILIKYIKKKDKK
ncbi:MAG: VTT domain-containing protein [Clostridia bacterium]|nr:VTT domain-containing protein [Clostridia bacterium]